MQPGVCQMGYEIVVRGAAGGLDVSQVDRV